MGRLRAKQACSRDGRFQGEIATPRRILHTDSIGRLGERVKSLPPDVARLPREQGLCSTYEFCSVDTRSLAVGALAGPF